MIDHDRLAKIKALADSGAAGEAQAARRMLDRLLAQAGMTEEQLEEHLAAAKVSRHDFNYQTEEDRTILGQVIMKVMDDHNTEVWTYTRKGRKVRRYGIDCTDEQADRITVYFKIYRDAWKVEKEQMISAFIQKHKLYAEGGPTSHISDEEMLDLLRRMQSMGDVTPPDRRLDHKRRRLTG